MTLLSRIYREEQTSKRFIRAYKFTKFTYFILVSYTLLNHWQYIAMRRERGAQSNYVLSEQWPFTIAMVVRIWIKGVAVWSYQPNVLQALCHSVYMYTKHHLMHLPFADI